jgi:hypothetical protein
MFRYIPGRAFGAAEIPAPTPLPTVTATFPATTPDLRSPDVAVPRADGAPARTEMIALVAVIAALLIVAVVLTIIIARRREKRKQIYPENDFEVKPTSAFVVTNIYAVNTVQP